MDVYLAGLSSGMVKTIIGHPLDTMKTWSQTEYVLNNNIYSLKNLYRGIKYPIISASFISALTFGIYKNIYNKTDNQYIAGFTAGFIGSFFITPLELLKVRAQENIRIRSNLFHGFLPTLLRETPAFTIYFSTYHNLRERNINILLSGASAGLLSWVFTYPMDSIKTRIQTNNAMTILDAIKMGGLWKGFKYCALRSILVNSIGFYTYELSYLYLNNILNE